MGEERVFINVDEKIAEAKTEEEKKAWEAERAGIKNISFCPGWDVWIYKQACGHWEVLQTPVYDGQSVEEAREMLYEESKKRECTRCICGWKR